MGVSPSLTSYYTTSGTEIEICIAPPHQFAVRWQKELLPGWNDPLNHIIIILQKSSVSLAETTDKVAFEKNRLRAKFIRLGCGLIFTLQDQNYVGDLIDPRTGLPLLTNPGWVWDDNAVVQALLNYPVSSYQNCTLLTHPVWNHHVYPGTIVASAPQKVIEPSLSRIMANYNSSLKIDN
ncbi:MAG: methylmalonic aciduria and homocystinuria type D protein [Cyanobacteria bacterium P01_G01_bin.39]